MIDCRDIFHLIFEEDWGEISWINRRVKELKSTEDLQPAGQARQAIFWGLIALGSKQNRMISAASCSWYLTAGDERENGAHKQLK